MWVMSVQWELVSDGQNSIESGINSLTLVIDFSDAEDLKIENNQNI